MKRFIIISILAVMAAAATSMTVQDQPDEYLGLPGDNFNLYAVMKLFQESETLEDFERSLNDENSRINNLDLNGDNFIDYIKVIDYPDGNVHTIVLQAVLGRNESQDVAVFTVQRFRDGSVQIQLTGDEVLYGRNYIVEPIYDETPNPGYTGSSYSHNVTVVRTTYYEVAAWPLVRFIFLPGYVVWRSSWYWGYYPHYWHPWRPWYWHYYYGYHYHWYPHYYGHYRHWDHHRYAHWNDSYYYSKRVYSHNVTYNINSGNYRTTYSHPEQRRNGEALYAQAHPERVSTMSSGNNTSRRSDSQITASRQPSGTAGSTTRRSEAVATDRSGAKASSGQNNAAERRSTATSNDGTRTNYSKSQVTGSTSRSNTTVSNRTNTNSTASRNTGSPSRSNTTVSDRTRTNPSATQNTGSTSRSNAAVNDRARSNTSVNQNPGSARKQSESVNSKPVSRSGSGQRTEAGRISAQSPPSGASPDRRSSEKSKSAESPKKSNDSKASGSSKSTQSDNSNSSRRK